MATTTTDTKAIVRRIETAVNERDHDLLAEVCAEDMVTRFHGGREEVIGLDAFEAYLEAIYDAFPDVTFSFDELVAEDDVVAVRYTGTATHRGEYQGVPPTGEEIQLSGMRFCRLEDGKIVEVWGQRDDLGTLVQLGVVEPP